MQYEHIIPTTPMRSFRQKAATPEGPFYVRQEPLAGDGEIGDITDEELLALAHLIHSAYLEWKRQ